jgi:hypothetical protein
MQVRTKSPSRIRIRARPLNFGFLSVDDRRAGTVAISNTLTAVKASFTT